MTGPETGKQRASRIPLDYFKRPDKVQRVKLQLTALALVLAVGWAVSGFVRGERGRLDYSRGPVASVHATWDAECQACHDSFRPIGSGVGMSKLVGHAGDQRCETCHAGPPHSERQIAAEVQSCADCHREHRGPNASLVRLPDSDCVRCHADLKVHVQKEFLPARFDNVAKFDAQNHSEFKAVRAADAGHLKFNHRLHMTAGQALTTGGKAWTLADIADPAERERYRRQQAPDQRDDTAPVQLNCASCHVLDSGDSAGDRKRWSSLPGAPLSPPRATGAYMQPIVYDNQCKACHPLTLEKPKDGAALTVPHRQQPDELYHFLTRAYTGYYLDGNPQLLDEKWVPSLLRPGEAPVPPWPEQVKARSAIAAKVVTAEKLLYLGKQTCGECHEFAGKEPVTAESFRPNVLPTFRIQPTQVPDVWFSHAKFNHARHQALDCRDCHARAYPDSADASTKASDVLVPGISNCVQCHAPASQAGGKRQGGARFDCTECHNYHHGDSPLQGRGAAVRSAQQKLTIQQFLSGR